MSCNHTTHMVVCIGAEQCCADCFQTAQKVQKQMYDEIQKHIFEHLDKVTCISMPCLEDALEALEATCGVYTMDEDAHEQAFKQFKDAVGIMEKDGETE